jgi:hypothetical protein
MSKTEAIQYLESLTNKQLVELLSEVFKSRRCDEGTEEEYLQAHWCIAEVSRLQTDDGKGWESWEVEILARHDPKKYDFDWSDNSPICQGGKCTECGTKLFSWAKKIVCPVCGAKAYAT